MINAFRMRLETRKAKKEAAKDQKKEVKQETKRLLNSCIGFARNGHYTMQYTYYYKTGGIRNAVAYNLRQKGYKVETSNYSDAYAITSISWAK